MQGKPDVQGSIAIFQPNETEQMPPARQVPGTSPNFSTSIADTKEMSIEKDKEMFPIGRISYADGSGFKGAIGAAAILFINGTKSTAPLPSRSRYKAHSLRRRTSGHYTRAPPHSQCFRHLQ